MLKGQTARPGRTVHPGLGPHGICTSELSGDALLAERLMRGHTARCRRVSGGQCDQADAQRSFVGARGSPMSSFIRNEECLFSAEYFPNHRRDRTGPHIPEIWQLGKLCWESCLATSPPHGGLVPTPEALGSDCQLGREPCLWQDMLAMYQLPFFSLFS